MNIQSLQIYGLSLFAVGGVAYAVMPYLSGDIKAEKRKEALQASRAKRGNERVVDTANRRKQIAESLKELDSRGKAKKKLTLEIRLMQAGIELSRNTYMAICLACGGVMGLVFYVAEGNLLMAAAAAAVGAFGLPSWILGFLRQRRMTKFVNEFPNAVDVIIRGIKSGLPLADCLRVIASELPEPIKSEFRRIVEAQTLGLSVTESVERLVDRVPVPESKFFAIVIGIQQKAGGNLAEALGNLSRVIRDRKKMKAKVKAVSSEAKTSAGIIGALPFLVGFFVYLTTPAYMEALWTTSTGRIVCAGCLIWMIIGCVIMKKMINFDI